MGSRATKELPADWNLGGSGGEGPGWQSWRPVWARTASDSSLRAVGMWGKRHLGRLLRGGGVQEAGEPDSLGEKSSLLGVFGVGQSSGSSPGFQGGGK